MFSFPLVCSSFLSLFVDSIRDGYHIQSKHSSFTLKKYTLLHTFIFQELLHYIRDQFHTTIQGIGLNCIHDHFIK